MSFKPIGSGDDYDVVFYAMSRKGRFVPLELESVQLQSLQAKALDAIPKILRDPKMTFALKGEKGGAQAAPELIKQVHETAVRQMTGKVPKKTEIRVAVVRRPPAQMMERAISRLELPQKQLEKLQSAISHLPAERQGSAIRKFVALKKAADSLRADMIQARAEIVKGNVSEGVNIYAKALDTHYKALAQAVEEWEPLQHFEGLNLIPHTLLSDLAAHFQTMRQRGLDTGDQKAQSFADSWNATQSKLTQVATSIQDGLSKALSLREIFRQKVPEERAFLAQVKVAEGSSMWEKLGEMPQHYDANEHRRLLSEVEKAAQAHLKLLEHVEEEMNYGEFEKAKQMYQNTVRPLHRDLLSNLQALVVLQDLLEGRHGTETSLSIDLYRVPGQKRTSVGAQEGLALAPLTQAFGEEAAVVKGVETDLKAYQTEIRTTQFTHILREVISTEKTFAQHLKTTHEFYQTHKGAVLTAFRDKRIPDVDVSYIFADLGRALEASEKLIDGMQRVVDLVNAREYQAALNAYVNLMKGEYGEYCSALAQTRLAQELNAEYTRKGVNLPGIFADVYRKLTGTLYDPMSQFPLVMAVQRPPRHILFAGEIFKFAQREHRLAVDAANEVTTLIARENARFNDLPNAIERYGAVDSLPMKLLLNPDLDPLGNFAKLLKKQGWSRRDLQMLSLVYDAFGSLMKSLAHFERALKVETDPERKRALKAQMRTFVEKRRERIDNVRAEFLRLMTPERQAGLRQALEAYAPQYSLQKQHLLTEMTLQMPSPGREKLEAFIEKYRQAFASDPEKLALLRRYEMLSLDPVETSLNALNERREAINQQMDFLHFSRNAAEIPIVKRVMSVNDPKWRQTLKSLGWTGKKLLKFQEFYDRWNAAATPVLIAKARYLEDRENPQRLEELRQAVAEADPKISRLSKELEKRGWVDAMWSLHEAIRSSKEEALLPLVEPEGNLNFIHQLQRLTRDVGETWKLIDLPQPTNRDYASSFLPKHPEAADVAVVYERLCDVLNPLIAMQRELEADPLNNTLEAHLISAIDARIDTIKRCFADLAKVDIEKLPSDLKFQCHRKQEEWRLMLDQIGIPLSGENLPRAG